MPDIDDNAKKELIKEAISEWLDKQFATFGKWSFGAIASGILAALGYWILTSNGWHK